MCKLHSVIVLLALTLPASADDLTFSPDLGSIEKVEILAEAPTLKELAAVAKSIVQLSDNEFVWLRREPHDRFTFIFNRAAVIQNGRAKKWAFVKPRERDGYIPEWDCEFGYCESPLVGNAARENDGIEGYRSEALLLSSDVAGGQLFLARWKSGETSGTGQYYTLRDVFLLQQPDGQWKLIGQGASLDRGRIVPGSYRGDGAAYRVQWNKDAAQPVSITGTLTHHFESDAASASLKTHQEGTLDPKSHSMHWSEKEYVVSEKGETIRSVANRIAQWRPEYAFDRKPAHLAAYASVIEKQLVQLNPRSAAKAVLPAGERILIPTSQDTEKGIAGSPTTQPRAER